MGSVEVRATTRAAARHYFLFLAMANTSGSSRDYVFTLFVYDDEDKLALWACPEEAFDATHPDFKYATWQIERAPTTGNLHVQGFLMLRKQMGRKRVQEVG